jgi:hypothetical protein
MGFVGHWLADIGGSATATELNQASIEEMRFCKYLLVILGSLWAAARMAERVRPIDHIYVITGPINLAAAALIQFPRTFCLKATYTSNKFTVP